MPNDNDQERMLRVLRDHGCKEGQLPEVSFALGWAVGLIAKRIQALNASYEGVDEPERDGVWKGTKSKSAY